MIDIQHENAKKVESWFINNNRQISCDDTTVFNIYKDISYYGSVIDNLSIKDRIRIAKIQISYIRKNILGLLHRQNQNSAKGIKQGYVYAIHNPAWRDYVKIGVAIDVYDRLKSYQTSSPFRDYELIGYVFANDRLELEKEIHSKFERNNEWIKTDKTCIKKFLKDHEPFPDQEIEMFCTLETIRAIGRSKQVLEVYSDKEKIKRFLSLVKTALVSRNVKFKNMDVLHKSTLVKTGNSWKNVSLGIEMQIKDGAVLLTVF